MRELLDGLSREELIDFIEDCAKSDPKFANTVNVWFCIPGFEEELEKIKRTINIALEGVNDYSFRDSWGNVSFETGDIITEIFAY